MTTKSYSEMIKLKTFDERFEYLKLDGVVGEMTFNGNRYLNQVFYKSPEWKRVRRLVIIRDNGFVLGSEEYPFYDGEPVLVHHINPITISDIQNRSYKLLDPENLVCTNKRVHDALHYGFVETIIKPTEEIERTMNDHIPWRKNI